MLEGSMSDVPNHASIVVTIGGQSRRYEAFVTSAPARLDAPSTMTLYASALADVAMFAANDVTLDPASARSGARLILVDTTELAWQRARCREARHLLVPADPWLAGANTLQPWLWRRLRGCIGGCEIEAGE
jgi:hypothetical protein